MAQTLKTQDVRVGKHGIMTVSLIELATKNRSGCLYEVVTTWDNGTSGSGSCRTLAAAEKKYRTIVGKYAAA